MRNVTAAVMASTLLLTTLSGQAAPVTPGDKSHPAEKIIQRDIFQHHMFDGISLTEQQRQQMRDLMQLARHNQSPASLREMETMHRLVTSDKFDEKAVRIQAEKMAQEQVARQVEMAKVRNQLFQLLTAEQRAVLNDRHKERMNQLRKLGDLQPNLPLQLSSSNQY